MPYVGNDWNPMSPSENRVLSIDLSPYVQAGDSLNIHSLAREFKPVIGTVPGYAAIPSGNPYLNGNIANQVIDKPAGGFPQGNRYLLGFTCSTTNGNVIQLWSYFWSFAEPPTST